MQQLTGTLPTTTTVIHLYNNQSIHDRLYPGMPMPLRTAPHATLLPWSLSIASAESTSDSSMRTSSVSAPFADLSNLQGASAGAAIPKQPHA